MLSAATAIDARMHRSRTGRLLPRRSLFAIAACGLVGCSGNGSSGPTLSSPAPAPAPVPAPAPPPVASAADVPTWHNDPARTGQYLVETTLTLANVNSAAFGRVGLWPVDGAVNAQPLFASSVTLRDGSVHSLVLAATEHNTVYAFDAASGTVLWKQSLMAAGETTSDTRGCGQVAPQIGITATPAIDRSLGASGTVFVAVTSKDASGQYFQRIHALDLASGAERPASPVVVQATYPGSGDDSAGGAVVFDPAFYNERAALLVSGGVLYTAWGSHCDMRPYTGWILAFDEATLAARSVLNVTPNGEGGAFWNAGAGPALDAGGSLFVLAANGTFDTTLTASGFPSDGDFGNGFLKISTSGALSVADYFATSDTVAQSAADSDLGSGGAMVLPDQVDVNGATRHLAVGAGKDGNIYMVDRDSMGKFDSNANHAYQVLTGALPGGVFSSPAYFNGAVYYGSVGAPLQRFVLSSARLAPTPASQTSASFGYPGTTPSISANGSSAAILWAVENGSPAVLHAYDAGDLTRELYNSNQNATRDSPGPGNKFITPTVAAGRVYVGTTNSVAVYGLLQ
ncbi:MAG TPA: pyrrolo-quinoline quinone [Burkholderiaceae bacterium]|nr:pyrrolo-quinoline quinone [Burkholderiaceae bacterium]